MDLDVEGALGLVDSEVDLNVSAGSSRDEVAVAARINLESFPWQWLA